MAIKNLTAERLRELLHYDPVTGVFTRRASRRKFRAGTVAGSSCNGYVYIGIDGKKYGAQRLAWLYVFGNWPTADIDHRDRNPSHNWIDNLRDVSASLNGLNVLKASINNKVGMLGVSPSYNGKRYISTLVVNRKRVFSKSFATAEEAHTAYLEAKTRFHPGFRE